MVKIKCPKRHVIQISESMWQKKQESGQKIKCKTCKKLYDPVQMRGPTVVKPTETKEEPKTETTEDAEEKKPEFQDVAFSIDVKDEFKQAMDDNAEQYKPKVQVKQRFDELTVATTLDMLFNAIAAKRGKFWKLQEEEKKKIVPMLTKLLNKYLGAKMGAFSDEVAFGIAFGVLILGRIMKDRDINGVKEAIEKKEQTPIQPQQEEQITEEVPQNNVPLKSEYPGLFNGVSM